MEPTFLSNLNPARVDPSDLVNRGELLGELRQRLRAWLRSPTPLVGDAFCLLGSPDLIELISEAMISSELPARDGMGPDPLCESL